jgi:hypothetical protein
MIKIFVLVISVSIVGVALSPVNGQRYDESGIRIRISGALGVSDSALRITRDYSDLFPGATFYRAYSRRGFDTGIDRAAVVVVGADTITVKRPEDLSGVWNRLAPRIYSPPLALDMRSTVNELLIQTGFLDRSDATLRSEKEVGPSSRAFLDPTDSLVAIRPPSDERTPAGERVRYYVHAARGVLRVDALLQRDGRIRIIVSTLAAVRSS